VSASIKDIETGKSEHYVAVYGTLKAGESNHRLLGGKNATYVCATKINAIMFDLGYYPCIVLYRDIPSDHPAKAFCTSFWAHCEVYRIDDDSLMRVDGLEGHPRHFLRQEVMTTTQGLGEVWVYTQNPGNMLYTGRRRLVLDGIWRDKESLLGDVDFYPAAKPRLVRPASNSPTIIEGEYAERVIMLPYMPVERNTVEQKEVVINNEPVGERVDLKEAICA
jgi:gamma-glutamylcyclotransferase (GGCT)/AIG2-like uncharacterized protein YtfP